jgi:PAT family beta-lactamase induction signal transducer AmpG
MSAQDSPPLRSTGTRAGTARRLVAVTAEGVASGTPLMVGSKLLQGWLTASGVPLALIGLIPLAELPYTLKLFWAPLLDRWPIPWPDRRRGWILVMQLLLVAVIAGMALLRPSTSPASLTAVGVAALVLAVCSATQDIVVDAYRTDLLPEAERGPGAAAASLGYPPRCWPWGQAAFCWQGATAGRRPSSAPRRWWRP